MNPVSFKGITNVGACAMTRQTNEKNVRVNNCLIAQLTDDFNGKDLTEFESVVKDCNPDNWYRSFPEDYRLIHIMTEYTADISKEIDDPIPKLYVNYHEVPVKNETLPMFSFIAKLTRKIFNMENFQRANDFKYGIIGRLCLLPNCDLALIAKNLNYKFKTFIDTMPFSDDASKRFAKEINKNINRQMKDFLK